VILANLENFNADFIKQWLSKEKRYERLVEIAKIQRQALLSAYQQKKLKKLE
jgi:hypothetical protein